MSFTTFVSMIHICNSNSWCQCFPSQRKWKGKQARQTYSRLENLGTRVICRSICVCAWKIGCVKGFSCSDRLWYERLMWVSIYYFFESLPRNHKIQHAEAFGPGDAVTQWQWVNHGIDIIPKPRTRWRLGVGKHCYTNNELLSQLFSTSATLYFQSLSKQHQYKVCSHLAVGGAIR